MLKGNSDGSPVLVTQFEVGRFKVKMWFDAATGNIMGAWNPDLPKDGETVTADHQHYLVCRQNFLNEIASQTNCAGIAIVEKRL